MNWILDAGHGGIVDGVYVTPGKRYAYPEMVIYEGVVNRGIRHKLAAMLKNAGIKYTILNPGEDDMPLKERVKRSNKIFREDISSVLLSIHSNAGGGSGIEVFTSNGKTKSDPIASVIIESYERNGFKLRVDPTDGDLDKEADFYVLLHTICPAVLVENLFMDNRAEAAFLLTEEGQTKIARTLFEAIRQIETA